MAASSDDGLHVLRADCWGSSGSSVYDAALCPTIIRPTCILDWVTTVERLVSTPV